MTITVEYGVVPPAAGWTRDWEQGTLVALARDAGHHIPESRGVSSPPSVLADAADYYEYYVGIAGLDHFIFQSCAHGLNLVDDPEFQVALTRQIGDDGAHAQRYREIIQKRTGHDPVKRIAQKAIEERELVGDITGGGLAGFLAFELSYELYTAPEFMVIGRTSRVEDPDVESIATERFGPDEFVHRRGIANWWNRHSATLSQLELEDLEGALLSADDALWWRRKESLAARWKWAKEVEDADYDIVAAIKDRWRTVVHQFLFES